MMRKILSLFYCYIFIIYPTISIMSLLLFPQYVDYVVSTGPIFASIIILYKFVSIDEVNV
jgi:hypothetical protein